VKKVIFDFGSNQGQNIKYYLNRADIVVCIEANLQLCRDVEKKFHEYIKIGRLFIEHYAVATNEKDKEIFYIHKKKNTQSQLLKPKKIDNFIRTEVRTTKATSIINKYFEKFNIDNAYYIKIDVEYLDDIILNDILSSKIKFDYISCEVHTSSVLLKVIKSKLKFFKIVIGEDVKNQKYLNQDNKYINFVHHSSGPFGNDIKGKWINKTSLITYFINNGLGWKDICCSYNEETNIDDELHYNNLIHNPPQYGFFFHLKRLFPEFVNSLKNILNNFTK